MQAHGVVEDELAGNHWDLGSNPRSTPNAYIILFHVIICRLPKDEHHAPHASACQVAGKADPVAKR